jgi:hypothetical protein
MPLDQPLFVVRDQLVLERHTECLYSPERPDPEELLLGRPNEPLGDVVPLMRPDKGRAGHE